MKNPAFLLLLCLSACTSTPRRAAPATATPSARERVLEDSLTRKTERLALLEWQAAGGR